MFGKFRFEVDPQTNLAPSPSHPWIAQLTDDILRLKHGDSIAWVCELAHKPWLNFEADEYRAAFIDYDISTLRAC